MPTHLENFRQFIRYGHLGTQTTRQEFVEQLHSLLYEGREVDLAALQDEAPYAVSAVKEILRDDRLRSLCQGEETVRQEVISELIKFLQVSLHTRSQSSDYEEEELALDRLKRLGLPSFPSYFKQIAPMLRQTYQRSQLDASFYTQELKVLRMQPRNKQTEEALQGLKSHLEERWKSLLQEKQLATELVAIDALRAQLLHSLSPSEWICLSSSSKLLPP